MHAQVAQMSYIEVISACSCSYLPRLRGRHSEPSPGESVKGGWLKDKKENKGKSGVRNQNSKKRVRGGNEKKS